MVADGINKNELAKIKPLVVGTEPFPGEALSSVLVRACEANVFPKIAHLLSLIGLKVLASESLPFTGINQAAAIAALLGTSTGQIEGRMHPAVQDGLGLFTVHWFGESMERRYLEASVRRFAPSSLEDSKYVPAIWGVRHLDYCPITMELLISECPHCSRELGWRACRSIFTCDKCGASLLKAKSRTVRSDFYEAARLGAALVNPDAAIREGAVLSLPTPFRTWSPADALSGIVALGEAHLSLERSHNPTETQGSAACIAAGLDFIEEWPASLERYVKDSTAISNSSSVRLGLGPLGKLFEGSAKDTPIRKLVRSSISSSYGAALIPTRLYAGGVVDSTCRAGMITALEVTKKLGIGLRSLRRLEGRSETFLARQPVKGGAVLYDEAAILQLGQVLGNSEKYGKVAKLLGIHTHCIGTLASASLIEPVCDKDARIVADVPLISKASIVELFDRLRRKSGRLTGGVTLREAMKRRGNPHDWVSVFSGLLTGRIRFQIFDRNDAALSDAVTVVAADIASYLANQYQGGNVSQIAISCQTSAELVGTSLQFISEAVKDGFISGQVGVRNSLVSLESVISFQRQFVVSDELREIFDEEPMSAAYYLRKAGFKPATIIYRVRVWRRSDVEAYIAASNNA